VHAKVEPRRYELLGEISLAKNLYLLLLEDL
jgi:hypothetical protein